MKIFKTLKEAFELKKINFPVLIVCFALSCFICYIVNSQNVESKTLDLTLNIENNQQELFVRSGPPETEHIILSLEGANVADLTSEDFKAYIDLSYVTSSGVQDFPVLLDYVSERAKNNISLQVKCRPSHIKMEVDEVVSAYLPVEPLLDGEVAKGYKIRNMNITPAYAFVRGASSRIKNRKSLVVGPVLVRNAKSSLSSEVGYAHRYPIVENHDEKFTVEIDIGAITEERQFNYIPVTIKNLDPSLEVSSQADKISLTLYGGISELDAFKITDEVIVADCSKIHSEGKFNVPITINLPSTLSVANNSIRNVPVTFNRKHLQVENINVTDENNEADKSETE